MMVFLPRDTSLQAAGLLRRVDTAVALLREADNETRITILALLPMLAALVWEQGAQPLRPLVLAIALVLVWSGLFARLRNRPFGLQAVPAAMLFAILLPVETPLWQAALSISFGITFGSLVFGGRGFSFLHPAVVALAFQFFSFPVASQAGHGVVALVAALAGGLLMFATGHLSRRTLAGFLLALAACSAWSTNPAAVTAILDPAAVLAVLFLICDPGSGSATRAGRWLHGAMAAGLVLLLGGAGAGVAAPRTLVFATLLASVLVPLIDRCVIMVHARSRSRRLERV